MSVDLIPQGKRKRRRVAPSPVLPECDVHQVDGTSAQVQTGVQEPTVLGREAACDKLVAIGDELASSLVTLTFQAPITCVYNPLIYAREPFVEYVHRHGAWVVMWWAESGSAAVGMNPGPFGMAQTGVPFGDSIMVREFLGIRGEVHKPEVVHPKRPIDGFGCPRREVSGQRLWGWAQKRFASPAAFFRRFWVHSFCPLAFMEASGRNRTPDKLPAAERQAVEKVCRYALAQVIQVLQPRLVVGIGNYAKGQIGLCVPRGMQVGQILHPSPANPKANKNWEQEIEMQLECLGVHF